MAEPLKLFTLLGATDAADAATRWPRAAFLPGPGLSAGGDDPADHIPLLDYLDSVLSFVNVLPGSSPDGVGLVADVVIADRLNPLPLVLRQLPDFPVTLQPNPPDSPARLFVTQTDDGVEVVVEGLPVEMVLPPGLLMPLRNELDEAVGPSLTDVHQAGEFRPGHYDTFEVVLRELTGSSLFFHLRVRLTVEGEVVLEPAVPLSIGRCRFSGLPCRAVHDLGFLPYPTLRGAHTEHELALEWARHDIPAGLGTEGTGLVTVRTLDLDHTRDPLRQLVERIAERDAADQLEFVLEDLALPVSSWLTPVATHGRFGLRRAVRTGGDEAEAYDFTLAPVELSLAAVVNWRLRIFRLLFESPATVVARIAVVFGDGLETWPEPNDDHSLVIDLTDDWLLQGAWLPPDPVHAFTLLNLRVSLMTAKLGFLLKDLGEAQGARDWFEHVRALVDLGVVVGDPAGNPFAALPPPGPPGSGSDLGQDVVIRDIGLDLGLGPKMPSLWFPEDLTLTAFEVVQLQVEEIAFVNEDNGGRYLSFSGGISIFPGAGHPKRNPEAMGTPGVPAENQPAGGGLRFRRLRLRTGGNELAPSWLLDGVSLFIRAGRFELGGFGSITDVTRDGHRFQEFAFGIHVRFAAMGNDFDIGAQVVYGRVTGPVDRFSYWLLGLEVGFVPVGPFELHNVRLLAAGGLAPDLPEPSGRAQEMRLLDWYKQNNQNSAVEVRSDRNQQRAGWKVEQGAIAAGIGASLCLPIGKAAVLRTFIFFHRGDSAFGILVAAEVFVLRVKDPVGTGAVEVDLEHDRWGAIISVDLELAKLFDSDSPLVKGLGRLTGTIFAGNDPGMFAIGQLTDQASWLTLSVDKSLLGLKGRLSVAFCLQVTAGDGPRGVGLAVTAAAGGSLGIGKVQLYAAFGLLAGVWGNEASSSGFIAWAEVGLRIKVFWVFSFGATVKAVFEQLGPQEPNYRRVSLEVRIETPWWLPDVTFRIEKVRDTPQPEAMPVLSMPVLSAGALEPGAATETPATITTLGAPGDVHTIAELRAFPPGQVPGSAWDSLTPVSVDSTIAVNFAVPMGNETTVIPSTAADAGVQTAAAPAQNQLSATYTITAVGIRRRARFGPDAGVWTDLLAPADSEIGGLDDLLNDPDPSVTFASAVRFRWDADVIRDGTIDPRRLLVNADTPYTFVTGSPGNDDAVVAGDPAFPCCSGKRTTKLHVLDFAGLPVGIRVPAVQQFTESSSTLRWQLPRPPVVTGAVGLPAGVPVARVLVASPTDRVIGVVTFDEPALLIDISVSWTPVHVSQLGSALVVEALRGLEVVDRQVFPLAGPSPAVPIRCRDTRGITSVTLRYVRQVNGVGTTDPSQEWLEIRNLRYRTLREERDRVADQGRCRGHGGIAGGGKLAWLPNHDYELAFTVRTTVDHQGSPQEAVVVQRAGFRTRGLPGLNAVESPGTELEPYVESVSPGTVLPLYRSEPVVVAFDERFSTLLPVDRTPSPTDPAERAQLLEWVLAVEQADGRRLSVPTADWVVAHRGTAPPPRPRGPRVIDDVLVRTTVRRAPSPNPSVQRLEALEIRSPSCALDAPRLHPSQVLTHAPTGDFGAGDPATALWPPGTVLRAAVRAKAAPFVFRRPFEAGDETALTVADEDRTTSSGWQVIDGVLSVAGVPAPGLRHHAVLGEAGWDHLKVRCEIDPAGGAAGVAVAVAGLPRVERALLALVDAAAGQLRLLARRGGATEELASTPLPDGAAAPFALEVLVFDDRVRARVGDTAVEAARGDLRDGRVAVVIDGPGGCSALHVDGLEAFVTQLATSRFADFGEHIASWDGVVRPLPAPAAAVAGLWAATGVDIAAVMLPDADPQLRQRLFDRWVGELAVPLSPQVTGLRLGSVRDGGGVGVLVVESPEPLPFSRDVRLTVSHRVTSLPEPPGVPRPLLRFAAGLVLDGDTVRGAVTPGAAPVVQRTRTLVHAVRAGRPADRVEYRSYRVRVGASVDGPTLEGELVGVSPTPPRQPFFPPRPLRIPVDHIALLDATGRALAPALPLPFDHDEVVAVAVLTNGVEDTALLIPSTPFGAGPFTFTWAIDRPRLRSAVADDTVRYRASAVTNLTIPPPGP